MRKYTDAIRKIRSEIKEMSLVGPQVRGMIRDLQFDETGSRRPETGPKRHHLRQAYVLGTRPKIRARLIAYGLLRGIPYKTIEARTIEAPGLGQILECIHAAIGEDEALKAEWPMSRVFSLVREGKDPLAPAAAAE